MIGAQSSMSMSYCSKLFTHLSLLLIRIIVIHQKFIILTMGQKWWHRHSRTKLQGFVNYNLFSNPINLILKHLCNDLWPNWYNYGIYRLSICCMPFHPLCSNILVDYLYLLYYVCIMYIYMALTGNYQYIRRILFGSIPLSFDSVQ